MRRTATLVVLLALGPLAGTSLLAPASTAPVTAPATAPVTSPAPGVPSSAVPAERPTTPTPRERTADAEPDDPAADAASAEAEGTVDQEERPRTVTEPAARDGAAVETAFRVAQTPAAGGVAGTGSRWRYTIEVAPELDVDVEEFARIVRAALTDDRSWARTRTLEQVDDPARARIRVVLASPDTVDELCGRAGLRTAGIYSCWNGRFAALNSWRWEVGADGFDDLLTYRTYLVNHEFGHGLGYGHVGCPGAGELAPVMMQQSKGVGACIANGWPFP